MRICVSGSSGLIGTALRQSLEADGHSVIRLVRNGAEGPGLVRWDIDRGEIDTASLKGIDAVVHLAGEGIGDKRWTPDQKRKILDSRTQGTTLLAEALASLTAKPAVLVSGSAIGFYGDRGDELLTEQSGPGTGFLTDVARAWEAAAQPVEAAGIRLVKIRTGIVLDRNGGALAKMASIGKLGLLGKLGSGTQWMSWVALVDHVRAVRFLIEREISGPVNVTAPAPVTNAVFTKALGRVLHRPTVIPVPRFGPKLLLGSELAEALLLEGQRVMPQVLVEAGFEFRYDDLETALRRIFDAPS
ncbi:MAG: TIGR01777 family oxidoreductase [Microthrixaceae bacterium]